MKKIIANFTFILSMSIKLTSICFALIGFVGLFVPLQECFQYQIGWVRKLICGCGLVLFIWLLAFLISILYVLIKRRYKLFDVNAGHAVYVQYGDVFASEEIKSKDKRRNIVIPVNRCFDTIINDDLISSNTVHGKFMRRLYEDNRYTPESLNHDIQKWLKSKNVSYKMLRREDKRSGNLKRYEVGAVSEVKVGEVNYFLLGLTSFDSDLHAHTADEEYVLALMRLIIYTNKRSQGNPLILPLIGAGAADTKKSERDILEYLVKLLKMNRNLINCDIHIVVRSTAKNRVAVTGL